MRSPIIISLIRTINSGIPSKKIISFFLGKIIKTNKANDKVIAILKTPGIFLLLNTGADIINPEDRNNKIKNKGN